MDKYLLCRTPLHQAATSSRFTRVIHNSTHLNPQQRTREARHLHSHRSPKTTLHSKIHYSLLALPVAAVATVTAQRSSSAPETNNSSESNDMSAKLVPTKPEDVMVIRDVTPNVVTLSVPFARFGIFRVGGRATIIRLSSGNLVVFSPVALTDDVRAKLTDMGGEVKYLIAGDIEHHLFLSTWKDAFPEAILIGPEGLQEKRFKANGENEVPKIGKEHFSFIFTPTNKDPKGISEEFAADFDVEYVDSHANKEIVLFYKPDQVLIQADLMFNLPAIEQYSKVPASEKNDKVAANRFFESLSSTSGEAKGAKRTQWYMFSSANRKGYNESARRIDTWDFTTLIPCHGETIENDAKGVFRKIFEWHLKGSK